MLMTSSTQRLRRCSLRLLIWSSCLSYPIVSTASLLDSLGNGLNRIGERVENFIDRTVDGITTGLTRTTPADAPTPPEVPLTKQAKLQTFRKLQQRRLPVRRATQVSSVINILAGDQLQQYLQDQQRQILVVMFSIAKKCLHCDRIKPAYQQLARAYPQAIFLNIDLQVPNMTKIAEQWGVTHFPTFFIFKPGENIATTRIVGAQAERLKLTLSELTQALAAVPDTANTNLDHNITETEE